MAEHGKMPIACDMGDCIFTALEIEHTALVAMAFAWAELKAALDCAYAVRGRFQLIDVTLARGVLAETLARFVAGVKRLNAVK